MKKFLLGSALILAVVSPSLSSAATVSAQTCTTSKVVVMETVHVKVQVKVNGKTVTEMVTKKIKAHVLKRERVKVHGKWVTKMVSVVKYKAVTSCTTPVTTISAVTTKTPANVYTAFVDPTFTQDQFNPLDVTYKYSASSNESPLPAGILNLVTPGGAQSYPCSVNVGEFLSADTCEVTYPAAGTYQVTTQYIPNGVTAVTKTESATISQYSTTTAQSLTVSSFSGANNAEVTSTVKDVNGNYVSLVNTGDVTFSVVDETTGATVMTLKSGSSGICDFTYFNAAGIQIDFTNQGVTGFVCGSGTTHGPIGDTYAIKATYVGSAGWSSSSSTLSQLP
jgi:hypothetical protein